MNERGQRGSRHEIRRRSERETRDRIRACGSGSTRVLYVYYVCMHVCVYIREDITSRTRIYLLGICHLTASSLAR